MDAALSVKRFLEQVKSRIEPAFASVCLEGEVSNLRTSGKHWYFTLKEDGAALNCAVWMMQQRLLRHRPENGQRVVVRGALNLYVAGGSLTFVVTHCEPAGIGDLHAQLRRLEAELRAEGLFDRAKRELPTAPRRLGVVAALGGAALRDVLEVTRRRAPGVDLLVYPAAAQGERCVPECHMGLLELQDPHWGCDAILLVRGGGSLEDLWGYNDPDLVRAVAECRVPVITGVGHEIDTTLVDLASDRRAATPSQAAELATPDRDRLLAEVQRATEALCSRMDWRLRGLQSTLYLLGDSAGMRAVPERLARAERRLEALRHRLQVQAKHLTPSGRLASLALRLRSASPAQRLETARQKLKDLVHRLHCTASSVSREADRPRLAAAQRRLPQALERLLAERRLALSRVACRVEPHLHPRTERLLVLAERLKGLDPTAPLHRGFVMALDADGKPLTSAQAAPPGAEVRLRWLDGERRARVEGDEGADAM